MGFFNGVKRVVKPLVDVPRWMQVRSIAQYGQAIKQLAMETFSVKKTTQTESFEELSNRLGLNGTAINQRITDMQRLLIFYSVFFIAIISYGIFRLIEGNFKSAFLL